MSETKKTIGLKIKSLRKTYGLSQIDLAEKLGLSFQQIQKYEKGITAISVIRLQQIADAFGVHITVFFKQAPRPLSVRENAPEYTQPSPSPVLSKEEITLLKLFRKIGNKKFRQSVMLHIKGLVEMEKEK
ncbi:MAG: helix-turn-helix domain-containing protein [Desulfobacterales bacterium]|nr:helix-turn-helix domain-containing protein [Desulfobacterales bacterium]